MKYIPLGTSSLSVPAIAIGCMRMNKLTVDEAEVFVKTCIENEATFFDHADIYGAGVCESMFGEILARNPGMRDKLFLQSKCGIFRQEKVKTFDFSKKHILESVDGSLSRLGTDHLDMLLLHRPDALMEPEEIAEAFDLLQNSGKVLNFGVSNHRPLTIELMQKYIKQPLLANQMQFSAPFAGMVASGVEVNTVTDGAIDRDGGVLPYCQLKGITIQTWSPFQLPKKGGVYIGHPEWEKLNRVLNEIAEDYGATPTTIATAWILRHPAKMQIVSGSMNLARTREILAATDITLTREEWYRIYTAAGHILP